MDVFAIFIFVFVANYMLYIERRSASETATEFVLYHFNRSEPTYKSQCIKLPDAIVECNQLIKT